MSVRVLTGDCLGLLPTLAEASVDSCVTDPPYHLTSIVKRFGADDAAPALSAAQRRFAKTGGGDRMPGTDQYGRLSTGFMGKRWDGGDVAFRPETWAAVLRVMKPGAHLIAFGGTRTYHRLACAIEDAGFEIRDQLQWIFGSGFPKSHDVSKGIDRAAGVEREVLARGSPVKRMIPGADQNKAGWEKNDGRVFVPTETSPATDAAREWAGWGTALKPAHEPIVLARKPLIGTVAANVLAHGTGALNVDGCRIAADDAQEGRLRHGGGQNYTPVPDSDPTCRTFGRLRPDVTPASPAGRWPANVIHDGSEEVVGMFPSQAGGKDKRVNLEPGRRPGGFGDVGHDSGDIKPNGSLYDDYGSAARFFYSAKADADDRLSSKHPTVKPVDLMAYLCRLITPPKGVVLDPFAGSGSTGMASMREGFDAILIEREAEYVADIKRRIAHVSGQDAPLFAPDKPYDAQDDFAKSLDYGYGLVRDRMAAGGPGWEPKG